MERTPCVHRRSEDGAMLVDGNLLRAHDELRADVCVIGAGPAGLATAQRLADLGHTVTLLESG